MLSNTEHTSAVSTPTAVPPPVVPVPAPMTAGMSFGGGIRGVKIAKANEPTLVECGDLKFVITDAPSDIRMEAHLTELIRFQVAHVARAASEAIYDTSALVKAGIQVHDVAFSDGEPPTRDVIDKWLDLVGTAFGKEKTVKSQFGVARLEPNQRISVHCVAGLGRAPVLVAVALIEYGALEPLEAVTFIRKHRRGAINVKQLKWLEMYQRTRGRGMGSCCVIC
jgi:protein tyrosine phosphatase type 4A